jgi:putative ABC transport system permease protein
VATPEVLALYHIDPAAVNDSTDLLSARNQALIFLSTSPGRPDFGAPPAPEQDVSLPPYGSAPNSLITPAAMQRSGWEPARAAWIVESAHPLTASQIDAARTAARASGLAVEVRRPPERLSALRTGATIVGSLVAMAIVAMAVGLIRGESVRDIRTLTATGATARTRRALTASAAGALALLGVLLGTAAAYIALVAVFREDLALLLPVPVTHLLVLVIGLPVTTTVAGWLLAGREPPTFARQVLE